MSVIAIAIIAEAADNATLSNRIHRISTPCQRCVERKFRQPLLESIGNSLAQHHIIDTDRQSGKSPPLFLLHMENPGISTGSINHTPAHPDGILYSQRVITIRATHRQAPITQRGSLYGRFLFQPFQDIQVFVGIEQCRITTLASPDRSKTINMVDIISQRTIESIFHTSQRIAKKPHHDEYQKEFGQNPPTIAQACPYHA